MELQGGGVCDSWSSWWSLMQREEMLVFDALCGDHTSWWSTSHRTPSWLSISGCCSTQPPPDGSMPQETEEKRSGEHPLRFYQITDVINVRMTCPPTDAMLDSGGEKRLNDHNHTPCFYSSCYLSIISDAVCSCPGSDVSPDYLKVCFQQRATIRTTPTSKPLLLSYFTLCGSEQVISETSSWTCIAPPTTRQANERAWKTSLFTFALFTSVQRVNKATRRLANRKRRGHRLQSASNSRGRPPLEMLWLPRKPKRCRNE